MVSFDNVKGLEFDVVVICDANKILHTHKSESAVRTAKNRLYVAITRARKELHIFCHRTIPAALWKVRNELLFNNKFTCRRCKIQSSVSEGISLTTEKISCPKCGATFKPPFTKDEVPVSADAVVCYGEPQPAILQRSRSGTVMVNGNCPRI